MRDLRNQVMQMGYISKTSNYNGEYGWFDIALNSTNKSDSNKGNTKFFTWIYYDKKFCALMVGAPVAISGHIIRNSKDHTNMLCAEEYTLLPQNHRLRKDSAGNSQRLYPE